MVQMGERTGGYPIGLVEAVSYDERYQDEYGMLQGDMKNKEQRIHKFFDGYHFVSSVWFALGASGKCIQ